MPTETQSEPQSEPQSETHTDKQQAKADYSQQFEAIRKLPLLPASTYIAVRKLPQLEEVSSSGIIIDDKPDKPNLHVALVIEAAEGCKQCEPGMLVALSPVASSYTVWSKGEELAVLKEEQIFGVYDDPDGKLDIDWQTFGKEESANSLGIKGYVM